MGILHILLCCTNVRKLCVIYIILSPALRHTIITRVYTHLLGYFEVYTALRGWNSSRGCNLTRFLVWFDIIYYKVEFIPVLLLEIKSNNNFFSLNNFIKWKKDHFSNNICQISNIFEYNELCVFHLPLYTIFFMKEVFLDSAIKSIQLPHPQSWPHLWTTQRPNYTVLFAVMTLKTILETQVNF